MGDAGMCPQLMLIKSDASKWERTNYSYHNRYLSLSVFPDKKFPVAAVPILAKFTFIN
jgi:hypothetical protein